MRTHNRTIICGVLVFALMGADSYKIDLPREIVFEVKSLGCQLVPGVGCGHLLAPELASLDKIEGVEASFSNWTGSRLRIKAKTAMDRDAVAQRVAAALSAGQRQPTRISADELKKSLEDEEWRGVDRIVELTSYEFRTFTRRQLNDFARAEKLDGSLRSKLIDLIDISWDQAAAELEPPKPDAESYAAHWEARKEKFLTTFLTRANELLSADQLDRLVREYAPKGK